MITNATAKFYEKDGCLWFNLFKPSSADVVAVPFEFDGPATAEHVKNYSTEFKVFTKAKEAKRQEEIEAAIKAALQVETEDPEPQPAPISELAEPNEETVEVA